LWLAVLALAMTAAAPAAPALTATVMTTVHLRAGPSIFYPGVTMLRPGSTAQVLERTGDHREQPHDAGDSHGAVRLQHLLG
jgi:hypothetical protein